MMPSFVTKISQVFDRKTYQHFRQKSANICGIIAGYLWWPFFLILDWLAFDGNGLERCSDALAIPRLRLMLGLALAKEFAKKAHN
jgi:hypothetical protein